MSPELQQLLSQVLSHLIEIVVALVASAVLALLYRGYQWVRSNVASNQIDLAQKIIVELANAAEKMGLNEAIMKEGASKREYVISMAARQLRAYGLNKLADNVPMLVALLESSLNQALHKSYPPITKIETEAPAVVEITEK